MLMPERNNKIGRIDITNAAFSCFMLAAVCGASLYVGRDSSEPHEVVRQRSDETDQQIFSLLLRKFSSEDTAAVEFDYYGRVVWRNNCAACMGVEIGDSVEDLSRNPEQEGAQIKGVMNTARGDGRDSGVLAFSMRGGEFVEMSYWATPDGFIASIEDVPEGAD